MQMRLLLLLLLPHWHPHSPAAVDSAAGTAHPLPRQHAGHRSGRGGHLLLGLRSHHARVGHAAVTPSQPESQAGPAATLQVGMNMAQRAVERRALVPVLLRV